MTDIKTSDESAASALGGTELFRGVQSAANVKVTAAQIKTFVSASPTLITPALGTPTALVLTNATGVATKGSVTRAFVDIVSDIYNVKNYGAKGDARCVTDAAITNTSQTVTSATAAFTSADVGKQIYGVQDSVWLLRLPLGTITSINSGTSVQVSIAATATATGIRMVFGTDDSDAIRAARVAADAVLPRGKVYLPAGGYMFSKLLFDCTYSGADPGSDCYSVEGDGSNNTILYFMPNFDFTTTQANQGALMRFANARSFKMRGIMVDGVNLPLSFSGNFVYPIIFGSNQGLYEDIKAIRTRGGAAQIYVLGSAISCFKCRSELAGSGDCIFVDQTDVDFYGCYAGNGQPAYSSLRIATVNGLTDLTAGVRWFGGNIDESGIAGCYVTASNDVSFIGTRIFGPSGVYGLIVDGTSIVRITNSEVISWSQTGNRGGLKVLSGGVAYVSDSRLDSIGTLFSLDNAGTVYDGGGNTYNKITGTQPVSRHNSSGNGQALDLQTLTELTTIAASATTDTTIQIPAGAVVLGVSTRVTVAIPTATAFDVGIVGATTRYATAVAVAANTTDAGAADGTRYYSSATAIRITPNGTPGAATGRLRVTIHYYTIMPPTS